LEREIAMSQVRYLPQAEANLSFAGISRQMKELNFSASSVPLW